MRNRPKVVAQISVNYFGSPLPHGLADGVQRLMCVTPRSVTETAFIEVSLENRLEQQHQRGLHYPVLHRRDAQRPLLAVVFEYPDPEHRTGPVALAAQLGFQGV